MDESSMVELAWEKAKTWSDSDFIEFISKYQGVSYEARREFIRHFMIFRVAHTNRYASNKYKTFNQDIPMPDFDSIEAKINEIDDKYPIYDDYEYPDFQNILKSFKQYRQDYQNKIKSLDQNGLIKLYDENNGKFIKYKEKLKQDRMSWQYYIILDLIKNKIFDNYDAILTKYIDNITSPDRMTGSLMRKYFNDKGLMNPIVVEYWENRLPKENGLSEHAIKQQILKLQGSNLPAHDCWHLSKIRIKDAISQNIGAGKVLKKILNRIFLAKRSKEVYQPKYVDDAIEILEEVRKEDNADDGDRYRVAYMIDIAYKFFEKLASDMSHPVWKKVHASNPIRYVISQSLTYLKMGWNLAYLYNKDCPNLDKGKWCTYQRLILSMREIFEVLNNEKVYSESLFAEYDYAYRLSLKTTLLFYWDVFKVVIVFVVLRVAVPISFLAFKGLFSVANNSVIAIYAFGVREAVLLLAKNGYAFYAVNGYKINEYLVSGAEFVIEEATGDQNLDSTTIFVEEVRRGRKILWKKTKLMVIDENTINGKVQKRLKVIEVKTRRADEMKRELDSLPLNNLGRKFKPSKIQVSAKDINEMRERYGIEEGAHTLAIGKTDVPGLEKEVFEGASRTIRSQKTIPRPTQYIEVSQKHSKLRRQDWQDHAEQDIFNHFIDALNNKKIKKEDLNGRVLAIHISNPKGVCPICLAGTKTDTEPGILLQFSEMFPELTIRITWQKPDGKQGYIVMVDQTIF